MNKHFSKILLLFLACFVGQANPGWISQPEFEHKLAQQGLQFGRATYQEHNCFDTASWVWQFYPCWVPWQTDIPTVAKFLAFLEGADSDYAAIAADPALQAKRISVLKDLQEVLIQIFHLFLWTEHIDPVNGADEIESFNAGFVIDRNFFRDLGQYFNDFVHELETLQDESHQEIVKRDVYKVYLDNFVQKMIVRLQERFAKSNDRAKDAIQEMRDILQAALHDHSHDLNLLSSLEATFCAGNDDSERLPYDFEKSIKSSFGQRKIEWRIFASSSRNVGKLRLQKRQFAIVVDFLNALKLELGSLFTFS